MRWVDCALWWPTTFFCMIIVAAQVGLVKSLNLTGLDSLQRKMSELKTNCEHTASGTSPKLYTWAVCLSPAKVAS